ncbi:hypothetical protein CC2G_007534 [Coprinopsis cinerea AmutBmut pab1-1]|nr:hypothetical protein CC2G_007534 [Coprinopsis cinerea AmutBmut pab1-1]
MTVSKRMRLDSPSFDVHDAVPEILADIDTEIALRGRLEETLQGRIQWALSMQSALRAGRTQKSASDAQGGSQNLQKLATDTLVNVELPSSILFATAPKPAPAAQPTAPAPYRRPAPRPKPFGHRSKGSFLFVNAQTIGAGYGANGPQYLLLKCPICSRTAFSSLQGLLNHARITHSIEYGTHDACIKACAVEDPSINLDDGIEVGLGPSGVLPGLQTLFQRAVGVELPVLLPDATTKQESDQATADSAENVHPEPSTLAQTLGIHDETAALAPFLGKEARRREIRVYDEDTHVDIGSYGNTSKERPAKAGAWRMTFAQRNVAVLDGINPDMEVDHEQEKEPEATPFKDSTNMETHSPRGQAELVNLPSSSGSRFHFTARISISDRNLFVAPEKRACPSHTHKWMIGVENPSYAIPLSSVLKYIKVTPLCEPEDFELSVDTADKPPYAIVGTARKPFLARVELVFNDVLNTVDSGKEPESQPNLEQRMVLEHWVDLDQFRTSGVVLGEEQLVDAELDRRTEVKPAVVHSASLSSKDLWKNTHLDSGSTPSSAKDTDVSPAYSILLELVRQYPLTSHNKDQAECVPYRLVSSRARFKNLVAGRQQAIKWARARAIKEAFECALEEAQMTCPSISTAELFLWLQEKEQAPGVENAHTVESEDPIRKGRKATDQAHEGWCGFCGLELVLHQPLERPIKQEENEGRLGECLLRANDTRSPCDMYRNVLLPGINDMVLFRRRKEIEQLSGKGQPLLQLSSAQNIHRQLVQSVDPGLISLVKDVLSDMGLSTFQTTDPHSTQYPIDGYGSRRSDVEASIAPHALIALALKCFLQDTVRQGVSQALKEKTVALQQLASGSRRGSKKGELPPSLLTPHHILAGNGLAEGRL